MRLTSHCYKIQHFAIKITILLAKWVCFLLFMAKANLFSIVDIETTGGDPKSDRITEIAIYVHDGEKIVDSFESLINPQMPIPPFITRMTGIDNEMVSGAPPFYEIAKKIVETTQDTVFVAHNARFDYSFIQKEFRQLGYTFTRKQICTVKLSRKLIPGLKSYSLKSLCEELEINNEASHRAAGDAQATVQLFEHLLDCQQTEEDEETFSDLLSLEIATSKLPPNLPRHIADALPDETGVYYFYDEQGEILYVGKSNSIRKRVFSHFHSAHKTLRTMRLMEHIHDISYEITGSELIALLLENEEIKRLQPRFNRAQKRTLYKHGIYAREEPNGYMRLYVDAYRLDQHPVAGFTQKTQAESALNYRGRKFQLCPKLYGAEKGSGRCFHHQLHICLGACVEEESPEDYNERVQQAIRELNYGKSDLANFLIIGAGRNYDERSVVHVQNGVYQGYAYLDAEMMEADANSIISAIPYKKESPDVQRILQAYIKRHRKEVRPY